MLGTDIKWNWFNRKKVCTWLLKVLVWVFLQKVFPQALGPGTRIQKNLLRKRFIPTVLPQKVIVPDFFSHSVKELIVWSPERLWARKKHPAARSIDRGTRSYVFVKVHAPKRSRGSCKCDSWKFIGGKLLSNEEKQLHPIRRVKMDTNRWKRSQ